MALPSVIRTWLSSLLKKALAPPISVTAKIWIGKFGMFIENALKQNKTIRGNYKNWGERKKTYFKVARDAFLFVEYTSMKPCTSSSRKALAP